VRGLPTEFAARRSQFVTAETGAKVANTRCVITLTQFEDGALRNIRVEDSCHECERGLTRRKGLSFIDGRPSSAGWVEAPLFT
jgi:hypothetical protein